MSIDPKFKPFPTEDLSSHKGEGELIELYEKWYNDTAKVLDGGEVDTLICLITKGPVWDGDVPSKIARDTLISIGLAHKCVVGINTISSAGKSYSWGYQVATYRGAYVYEALKRLDRIKSA